MGIARPAISSIAMDESSYIQPNVLEHEKPRPERQLPEVHVGETIIIWRQDGGNGHLEGGWKVVMEDPTNPDILLLQKYPEHGGGKVEKKIAVTRAEANAANDTVRNVQVWVNIARSMGIKVPEGEENKIAEALGTSAYKPINIHVAKTAIFESYPRETSQNHSINEIVENLEKLHDSRYSAHKQTSVETVAHTEAITSLETAQVKEGDKNIVARNPQTNKYEPGWTVITEVSVNEHSGRTQQMVLQKGTSLMRVPIETVQADNALVRTGEQWAKFGGEIGVHTAVVSPDILKRKMSAEEAYVFLYRTGRQKLGEMDNARAIIDSLTSRQKTIESS